MRLRGVLRAKLPPKPLEKEIQSAIMDFLKAHRIFCWRNNTGATSGFHNGKKWFMHFGQIGSGDIIGLLPGGRFFSIEVKRPGAQPTFNQIQFMNEVNRNGGLAFVAFSVDDVESKL